MQLGRISIMTDEPTISYENVIDVLRKAMPYHIQNAARIDYLLRYEAGEQPIIRKEPKKYRPSIDCQCQDNIANEVTEFKRGFLWGNPITLVQSADGDDDKSEAIALLNAEYEADNERAKTQQIGRYVEIGAICNEYIDLNEEWQEEGDSYHTVIPLDPRTSFVIKSSYYVDQRVMMGVTFRQDNMGNKFFTCITKSHRYEIKNMQTIENGEVVKGKDTWQHDETRSGELNPFGVINIVEWMRSYDRMGAWERQISEMDNLNLLISDYSNDIEQNCQAIWWAANTEFPKEIVTNEDGTQTEQVIKPKDGEWLNTFDAQDGKQSKIQPLTIDYDYAGMLDNIVTRRALILQKCNIPQRNDNSGGSTGVAMSDATGWSAAEMAANAQQPLQEMAKMQEVKVVLAVIKKSPHLPADSPLRELKPSDVQPNVKRQRTYELTVKTNAICALLAKGFSLEDSVSVAPLFEDPNATVVRSGEGVKKYQEANVFRTETSTSEIEEKRPFADYSDQISNSPNIDGMNTGGEAVTA